MWPSGAMTSIVVLNRRQRKLVHMMLGAAQRTQMLHAATTNTGFALIPTAATELGISRARLETLYIFALQYSITQTLLLEGVNNGLLCTGLCLLLLFLKLRPLVQEWP